MTTIATIIVRIYLSIVMACAGFGWTLGTNAGVGDYFASDYQEVATYDENGYITRECKSAQKESERKQIEKAWDTAYTLTYNLHIISVDTYEDYIYPYFESILC